MGNSPTSSDGQPAEFPEMRKSSKSVQYKSSHKNRNSIKKIINEDHHTKLYKGIKISNDPIERDIYVSCPFCNTKVFDSGLESELQCKRCTFKFSSDKAYNKDKIRKSLKHRNDFQLGRERDKSE